MVKKSGNNNIMKIAIIVLIIIAIPLTVGLANQKTAWFNFAKSPKAPTNININSEVAGPTNNIDGTMGPVSFEDNFSFNLPPEEKGALLFKVNSTPGHDKRVLGTKSDKKNAPEDFLGIFLTISKVEVHIAQQGDPTGKGKSFKNEKGLEKVDKWQTLDLVTPITIDLMQLSDTDNLILVAISSLASGHYTQVRLYIDDAKVELQNEDEVNVEIQENSGTVKIVKSFTINPQDETTLIMEFDPKKSIRKTGNKYFLKPVIAKMQVE